MNRAELWHKLKLARVTLSDRNDFPPDGELKIVIQHAQMSATRFIDFICSLDEKPKRRKLKDEPEEESLDT